MASRFWQREVECMPLPQLAGLQEDKLKQSRVIERAYASALYRERWQKSGVADKNLFKET